MFFFQVKHIHFESTSAPFRRVLLRCFRKQLISLKYTKLNDSISVAEELASLKRLSNLYLVRGLHFTNRDQSYATLILLHSLLFFESQEEVQCEELKTRLADL